MSRSLLSTLLAVPVALLTVSAYADLGRSDRGPVDASSKDVAYQQVGTASWYGPGFHGKETANGEIFDPRKLTAAHRKLPLGAEVKVTNLDNGKTVTVKINDRGPYKKGRVLDLSKAAAKRLGMVDDGLTKVRIEATKEQLAEASSN